MRTKGKEEHIALTKLALKKLIDEYTDMLKGFKVAFEDKHFGINFRIELGESWSHADGSFQLIPDIVADIEPKEDIFMKGRKWKSIADSRTLIFEVETSPTNIFQNIMKMQAYSMVKNEPYGRSHYAFILVCWEDAKLPEILEPFDAVWKFSKLAFKVKKN